MRVDLQMSFDTTETERMSAFGHKGFFDDSEADWTGLNANTKCAPFASDVAYS